MRGIKRNRRDFLRTMSMSGLGAVAGMGLLEGQVQASTVTRDAGLWPFLATDPFNTPIGSGAIYTSIISPLFTVTGGAYMNSKDWSHPIFLAKTTDPIRHIWMDGVSTPIFAAHVPDAAKPDPSADGHLHIIDPTHNTVIEMYQAYRKPNGDFVANDTVQNNIRGAAVYSSWHGERAYGGSAIAGLIRKGELITGIPHAITLMVERASMNQHGPGGNPYVWPASSADNGYQTDYGTHGNLYMGSLLAIPPTVDITKLGVGSSGPGYQIAKALQNYGGYIVDSSGDNMTFQSEPAAVNDLPGNIDAECALIIKALKVVSNNGRLAIGGGGTARRAGWAPPFAP